MPRIIMPTSEKELFQFYVTYVKPLYASVQASGTLPVETLFELNSAFDHLSRIYTLPKTSSKEIEKAFAHLKRSCLDIFKIKLRDTQEQYKELCLHRNAIALLNNGTFANAMDQKWYEIREYGKNARIEEAKLLTDEMTENCFGLWENCFNECVLFEQNFFRHPNIEWAKSSTYKQKWKEYLFSGFIGAVIGSLLEGFLGISKYLLIKLGLILHILH